MFPYFSCREIAFATFRKMNLLLVMADKDCNGECDKSSLPSAPQEDILLYKKNRIGGGGGVKKIHLTWIWSSKLVLNFPISLKTDFSLQCLVFYFS